MRKYFCDVCKKEEEVYNLGQIKVDGPWHGSYTREYELCRKCYKDLLKLMENFGLKR